jgi:L-asparaginase
VARNIVVVITTGGTIAMQDTDGDGAIPSVDVGTLLTAPPPDLTEIEIQVEEFSNLPSVHLTVEQLWQLQKTVSDRLDRLYVRGVVVTHGTDTLEETAYLLDYTIPIDKAVVVTGAMRTYDQEGYEGLHNLWNAIRVAAMPESDGRGAMVALNDEIHAARYVTKAGTHDASAFESPAWGPMGRIYGNKVIWGWNIKRDYLPVRGITPDVHLVPVTAGASDILLKHLVEKRVRGIVIEAVGAVRVPPWWLSTIREATTAGIAVVIATRTGRGFTHDGYAYEGSYKDLEAAGVIFAEGLSAVKARIRLMCALGVM